MTIQLFDTTLRDGTQGEGVSFSADDKLRIAARLDDFGVDYIEGGWPGSNPKDMEFFERAAKELTLKRARLVAFGSTCRVKTKPANDPQIQLLIEANTPVVAIFGKSWEMQVTDVLRTTLDENLRMIRESVAYVKSQGREVIYDAEHFFDGYKTNPEYALSTLKAAVIGGADAVVLCDTNGGCLPWEIADAVTAVRDELGIGIGEWRSGIGDRGSGRKPVPAPHSPLPNPHAASVTLGIHAHNDSGTGVANTLAAVRAGANHVQGTINGYGERCGNADLVAVIADLQLKMGYEVTRADGLRQLADLSHFVSELANLSPDSHQPFVGQSAFAHKGGTHVNAVVKNVMSYQHVDPSAVGNQTRVLVSELSGKDNIAVKREEFGLRGLSKEQERAVLRQIKDLENAGFAFESAEASVELLLRRTDKEYYPPFELIDYTARVAHRHERGLSSEATVKVRVCNEIFHEVAEGNGPVNALDLALRKAIRRVYPSLDRMSLKDYKVRILDSQSATGARVRVLIDSTDGERSWGTVGASSNIIEASWRALSDSFEYFLLTDEGTDASGAGKEAEPLEMIQTGVGVA